MLLLNNSWPWLLFETKAKAVLGYFSLFSAEASRETKNENRVQGGSYQRSPRAHLSLPQSSDSHIFIALHPPLKNPQGTSAEERGYFSCCDENNGDILLSDQSNICFQQPIFENAFCTKTQTIQHRGT